MDDMLGTELKIGDEVAYTKSDSGRGMLRSCIIRFSEETTTEWVYIKSKIKTPKRRRCADVISLEPTKLQHPENFL